MDKTNALSLRGGGMFDGGWTPEWIIRDEFTDTLAAGSVDGTAATPGPGTRAVTDTESKLSVGGGALAIAGGKASPAHGDPGVWYAAQTRASGIALIVSIRQAAVSGAGAVGFDTDTAGTMSIDASLYWYAALSEIRIRYSSVPIASVSNATDYQIAIVLGNAGANYFIRGGAFSGWAMIWSEPSGAAATLYPGISNLNAQLNANYVRVAQLPAPFDADDGLATDTHSGSLAAGTTFVHEANALIEYTLTTRPSAGNADVLFRVQDASNYWVCRVNSSGDISLAEVVAGTPTTRGTAAGVVASGHRVVIIADGTTVRLYSNNTLRVTYASASSGATATAGEVDALGTGGVVSNVKSWPRTLSGTAASILNKASA